MEDLDVVIEKRTPKNYPPMFLSLTQFIVQPRSKSSD